jgi:adenylate cyclase
MTVSDIFALQDEISEAIVAALKLKLLPEERRSITNRGTDNVEAYNLHLMARQQWESGDGGSSSWGDGIIRFSRRATEIDPNYAIAWALLGIGQVTRAWHHGLGYESAIASAERALALDPNLPEAHAAKAQAFAYSGRYEEAIREAEIACRLEPRSNLANNTAGVAYSMAGRPDEAIVYLERACALDETDIYSPTWVLPYYSGRNHRSGLQRAAAIAIDHADKALEHRKGSAQAHSVKGWALAALGQRKEAQEWMDRALLIDPDNVGVRFHIAFALLHYFKDADAAVDMLRPVSRKMSPGWLDMFERSFGALRSHPRFIAMLAEVKERLAAEQVAGRPPA